MPLSPDTLYNMALNFLSNNVQNIESLVGFPSTIGVEIFKGFLQRSEFVGYPSQRQMKIIKTFTHAYNSEVLEVLKLPKGLILINEYLDPLIELTQFVTGLCLCSCLLGNNHELFDYISTFDQLKSLCLRKNSLKDDVVRKITIRIRTFNKGPKELEYLDLSENELTDAVTKWLKVFTKLNFLNLSNCYLTDEGIKRLESVCNVKFFFTWHFFPCYIQCTKGWATPLVEKWKDIVTSRENAKKTKKRKASLYKIINAAKKKNVAEKNAAEKNDSEKKDPEGKESESDAPKRVKDYRPLIFMDPSTSAFSPAEWDNYFSSNNMHFDNDKSDEDAAISKASYNSDLDIFT